MKASEANDIARNKIQQIKDGLIPAIEQDIINLAKDGYTHNTYSSISIDCDGMYLWGEDTKVEGWLKENGYKYSIKDGYLESISRA